MTTEKDLWLPLRFWQMRKKKFNFRLLYKHKAQEGNFQKRSDIKGNATELYEYKQVRFARAPINFFQGQGTFLWRHRNIEKFSK